MVVVGSIRENCCIIIMVMNGVVRKVRVFILLVIVVSRLVVILRGIRDKNLIRDRMI